MRVKYKNRWYAVRSDLKRATIVKGEVYYKGSKYTLVAVGDKIVACRV